MRVLSIEQLRAKLLEYLRLARASEKILVSDQEEVVAELRPARRQRLEPQAVEAVLESLAARGLLTRAEQPKEGWSWSPPSLGLRPEVVWAVLGELAENR